MTEDEEMAARNKSEMRVMWGFSAAVVLLILGAMGANMMWGHHDAPANAPSDISSQSRTTPQN